uniref:Uncharacterized protein n=1 Tax=Aegilops tauschii subsp. strangulata TaxID=200361 RepID=A0A453R5G5_AEGTS
MASKAEACIYICTRRKGRGGRSASPCGHRARTNSLSAVTVVAGSYLLGPMSVPSNRRNFTSIGSFPPAISPQAGSPPDARSQQPPAQSTAAGQAEGFRGGKKKLANPARRGQEPMRIPRRIGSAFSFC